MRLITLTAAAVLLLAGCAYPSAVQDNFGRAVVGARAAQVIDPDAPSRAPAPQEVDGQAAKASIDRYQKSYQSPPPPVNVFNIGIGGSGGSGGVSN